MRLADDLPEVFEPAPALFRLREEGTNAVLSFFKSRSCAGAETVPVSADADEEDCVRSGANLP